MSDRDVFAFWWYLTQFKAAVSQGLQTAAEQHADTLYHITKRLAHEAPAELKHA